MESIVVDSGIGFECNVPVTGISCNAIVCTTAEFTRAGRNWLSLVANTKWQEVNMTIDTAHFADLLEAEMGRVQMKQTGTCVWDRSKLTTIDCFKQQTIMKAIPCVDGQHYVVGVFIWK